MSPELRTALWNLLHRVIFQDTEDYDQWRNGVVRGFYDHNHLPLHAVSLSRRSQERALAGWWFDENRRWWELYNTVDHLGSRIQSKAPQFLRQCNVVLELEGSRFRFVGTELTEITDENEIAAINESIGIADRFGGAREHITAALRFLGLRPTPDYRNSIRESISAVESSLKVLTDLDHADLSSALQEFARAHPIHGALFKGLNSLYGYTSNEHGIRHALLDEAANVGFAEAKFMVVACAAFVNFLIAKGAA